MTTSPLTTEALDAIEESARDEALRMCVWGDDGDGFTPKAGDVAYLLRSPAETLALVARVRELESDNARLRATARDLYREVQGHAGVSREDYTRALDHGAELAKASR